MKLFRCSAFHQREVVIIPFPIETRAMVENLILEEAILTMYRQVLSREGGQHRQAPYVHSPAYEGAAEAIKSDTFDKHCTLAI